jgi:hypothetical protein
MISAQSTDRGLYGHSEKDNGPAAAIDQTVRVQAQAVRVGRPEGNERAGEALSGVRKELAELTATVASFEAFFAVSLLAKLETMVDERVTAAERARARPRWARRLLLASLLANVALGALLFSPAWRETAADAQARMEGAVLVAWHSILDSISD